MPPTVSRDDEPTRTATVERPRAGSASGTENKTYTAPASDAARSAAAGRGGLRIAAGIALLATVGLVAYLAGGRGRGTPAATSSDVPLNAPTSSASSAPAGSSPAAQVSAPAASGSVTIEVVTRPRGAMVELGESSYGPTPTEFELPEGNESVTMTIRLAGYLPVERTVAPDKAQRLELGLQRAARGQARTSKPTATPTATPSATGKDFWRFE